MSTFSLGPTADIPVLSIGAVIDLQTASQGPNIENSMHDHQAQAQPACLHTVLRADFG